MNKQNIVKIQSGLKYHWKKQNSCNKKKDNSAIRTLENQLLKEYDLDRYAREQ